YVLRAYETDRRRDYLAALAVLLAGTATHPTFVFPVIGVVLALTLVGPLGQVGWTWPSRRAWAALWGPFLAVRHGVHRPCRSRAWIFLAQLWRPRAGGDDPAHAGDRRMADPGDVHRWCAGRARFVPARENAAAASLGCCRRAGRGEHDGHALRGIIRHERLCGLCGRDAAHGLRIGRWLDPLDRGAGEAGEGRH